MSPLLPLLLLLVTVRSCGAADATITVEADRRTAELRHFWTSTGFWWVRTLRSSVGGVLKV